MFRRFLKDQRGATAIEYGLIASLVFLAASAAIFSFKDKMASMYDYIGETINTAMSK